MGCLETSAVTTVPYDSRKWCKSIAFVLNSITSGHNCSDLNPLDITIYLEKGYCYEACVVNVQSNDHCPIELKIVAEEDERPVLLCKESSENVFLNITENLPIRITKLTIKNAIIESVGIHLENVDLELDNVLIKNSQMQTTYPCDSVKVSMTDTILIGTRPTISDYKEFNSTDTSISAMQFIAHCDEVIFKSTRSIFRSVFLSCQADDYVSVTMKDAEISSDFETFLSIIEVNFGKGRNLLNFDNCSIWNMRDGGITFPYRYSAISLNSFAVDNFDNYNSMVMFTNSKFVNNSRALGLRLRGDNYIQIIGCNFTNNSAGGAGGALLVTNSKAEGSLYMDDTYDNFNIMIANSEFYENVAHGFAVSNVTVIPSMGGAIFVDVKNTKYNKPVKSNMDLLHSDTWYFLELLQRSTTQVINCKFQNNLAYQAGSTLYLGYQTVTTIQEIAVDAEDKSTQRFPTGVISSRGSVFFKNNNRVRASLSGSEVNIVNDASDIREIINLTPGPSLIIVAMEGLNVTCPVGHEPRLDFRGQQGLSQLGIFNSFTASCISCQPNTYSLSAGTANITYKLGTQYEPMQEQFSINKHVSSSVIHYQTCPLGAECQGGRLRNLPGFWGSVFSSEVKMYRCPVGFCNKVSSTYGTTTRYACSENREGRLCGTCLNGYSENIADSTCSETMQNTPWWMVLSIVAASLFYVLFFLFQDDLTFILSWPVRVFVVFIMGLLDKNKVYPSDEKSKTDSSGNGQEGDATVDGRLTVVDLEHNTTSLVAEAKTKAKNADSRVSNNAAKTEIACCNVTPATNVSNASRKVPPFSNIGQGLGYMQILFHLAHVSYLVVTQDVEANEEVHIHSLSGFISALLSFDVFKMMSTSYRIAGLNAQLKVTLSIVFVLMIFLWWVILSFMWLAVACIEQSSQACSELCSISHAMVKRLTKAFIDILFFGYFMLSFCFIKAIKCVDIDGSYWYYDATLECSRFLYNVSVAVLVLVLAPLPFVVFFGSLLLRTQRISGYHFIIGCVCPLPILCYWISLYHGIWRHQDQNPETRRFLQKSVSVDSETAEDKPNKITLFEHYHLVVNNILLARLCNQFRLTENFFSPSRWESVYLVRIFVFVGLYVLYDVTDRTYLTITAVMFLVHHIWISPFAHVRINVIEMISLVGICFLFSGTPCWISKFIFQHLFWVLVVLIIFTELINLILECRQEYKKKSSCSKNPNEI